MTRIGLLLIGLLYFLSTHAQALDKAEKDQLIYEELTADYELENWHPDMIVASHMLKETDEKGIFIVKGDSFQVKSIRSDFYVCEKNGRWTPLNDSRFPLETMVNLLLNRIENNRHQLQIRHHQYGNKKPTITIPMQKLHDLFARNMQIYCSVTYIGTDEIRAVLVFHQKRQDFIHMLELKIPTKNLFDEESTMTGDLYTNIPQDNVNSIFREKGKKQNENNRH